MKKMLLFALLVSLSSCLTVNLSELKPSETKNKYLLPMLEPVIDMDNFESVYQANLRRTTTSIVKNSDNMEISTGNTPRDERMDDAITIFRREVRANITEPFGDKKGTIVCRVAALNESSNALGFTILSVSTFYTLNLLGMPMGKSKTDLDVEVEIYTNSDKLIGVYSAQANAGKWISFYYGYTHSDAARLAHILAFKAAMADIASQIDTDSSRLAAELYK